MPSGLIEEDRVSAGRHSLRDLLEVQGHGLGRAAGENEASRVALGWQIAPKM